MIYCLEGFLPKQNMAIADVFVESLVEKLKLLRLRKPYIHIKFVNQLDALGYCSGDKNGADVLIAKKCPITKRKLGFIEMMQTLAHEMVHARQVIRGELICEGGFAWKGRKADGYEYENQPWEKEAYRLEGQLFLECFPMFIKFNN